MKEHVAVIVAAYVGHNTIAASELPALIASVDKALAEPVEPALLAPAVPVRRSVKDHVIICLDCGWSGQMLRRHLMTAHGLTPDQYRERWKLSRNYPLVTKNYASRRSELAKAFGLGTQRQTRR
ncbi:MAG TPA: MucR family transcriptional regulator [Xanthobacteraceae bacterium]|nr:MucR family transcriptional regulator [Xanthobacteraceae bacterium]